MTKPKVVGQKKGLSLLGALTIRVVAKRSRLEEYFIVTAADGNKPAMERTLEGFRAFTSCLNGAKEKGIIYGTGAWKMGDIKGSEAMKEAYETGRAV